MQEELHHIGLAFVEADFAEHVIQLPETTEALIERLRKRVAAIEEQLADPTLYERDSGKVTALSKERAELSDKIARQEDLWLNLSSEYEEANAA